MEGFEFDGPPLAGRTLPVLPFPGTVTVTCTADSRQPETCVPKGQPGVSVIASGEIKVERTPTFLDMDGCPFQNLSIQTTLKFGANAEAKGAKVGGQVQAYLGRASKYQITVTPNNADEIEAGRRAAPNPVDPRSLAKGEAIQLNEDYFAGIKAKGTYREYQLEMGYDTGRRVSSGIKRMDERTVRVMVGDEDFVKQALKLGIKVGDVSALARQHEGAQRRQAPRDRHRHLDRGRLERLPALRRHGQAASARLGRHEGPDEGRDRPLHGHHRARGQARRAHDRRPRRLVGRALGLGREPRDGTTTDSTNARYNDTSLTYSFEEDANGNPTGTPRYSLMLHDVHDSYIPTLYERTGQKPPAGDPPKDLRIDFTEAELRELQELALTRIGERMSMDGDGRPTNDEIRRAMQGDGRSKTTARPTP